MNGVSEYIIHHVFSLWMIFGLLMAPGQLTRFFPHILISDTTNIFFNIAWLLRLAGFRGNPIVTFCEAMFAIAFFFLRSINLAIVLIIIFLSPPGISMGISRYTLPPILLLQWYWMSKIIGSIVGAKKPKSENGDLKKKK